MEFFREPQVDALKTVIEPGACATARGTDSPAVSSLVMIFESSY
jgi:hypothetical protein